MGLTAWTLETNMALEDVLMERATQPTAQPPAGGLLLPPVAPVAARFVAPPPKPKSHLPTAFNRWLTAEKMKDGYRNNWTPNPVLIGNAS